MEGCCIYVRLLDSGRTFTVEVEEPLGAITLAGFKKKVEGTEGIPSAQQIYSYNGHLLAHDHTSLTEYEIYGEEVIDLTIQIEEFEILIKTLTGRAFSLLANSNTTLEQLKMKVLDKENIPISEQRYMFSGKQLTEDWRKLTHYGIKKESIVFLILRVAQPTNPPGSRSAQPTPDLPAPPPREEVYMVPKDSAFFFVLRTFLHLLAFTGMRLWQKLGWERFLLSTLDTVARFLLIPGRRITGWIVYIGNIMNVAFDNGAKMIARGIRGMRNITSTCWNVVNNNLRYPKQLFGQLGRWIFKGGVFCAEKIHFIWRHMRITTSYIFRNAIQPLFRKANTAVLFCARRVIDAVEICSRKCTSAASVVLQAVKASTLRNLPRVIAAWSRLWNEPLRLTRPLLDIFFSAICKIRNAVSLCINKVWNAACSLSNFLRQWVSSALRKLAVVCRNTFQSCQRVWHSLKTVAQIIARGLSFLGRKLQAVIKDAWNIVLTLCRNVWSAVRHIWKPLSLVWKYLKRGFICSFRCACDAISFCSTKLQPIAVKIWNTTILAYRKVLELSGRMLRPVAAILHRRVSAILEAAKKWLLQCLARIWRWSDITFKFLSRRTADLGTIVIRTLRALKIISVLQILRRRITAAYATLSTILYETLQVFNWKKGITRAGYTVDIRPGALVHNSLRPGRTPLYVLEDNATFCVYLHNGTHSIVNCVLFLDGEKMGVYKMLPLSGYTIERPVSSPKRFVFVAKRDNNLANGKDGDASGQMFDGKDGLVEAYFLPEQNQRGSREKKKLPASLRRRRGVVLNDEVCSSVSSSTEQFGQHSLEEEEEEEEEEEVEEDENPNNGFIPGTTTLRGLSNQRVVAAGQVNYSTDSPESLARSGAVIVTARLVSQA